MTQLQDFFSANALYFWCALAAVVVLVGLWVLAVQLRLNRVVYSHNRLIGGVDEGNLEDALGRQIEYILEAKAKLQSLQGDLARVSDSLQLAVQRVGLVRFNPFDDTGGDQSFAVALLDAQGDGIVLSSLFARRETRVFAKSITGGKSSHLLTDEEARAIQLALASTPAGRKARGRSAEESTSTAAPAQESES